MRIKWSNRLTIVDLFLRKKDMESASQFAGAVLSDPESEEMLTKEEVDYLKLVVACDKAIQDMDETKD